MSSDDASEHDEVLDTEEEEEEEDDSGSDEDYGGPGADGGFDDDGSASGSENEEYEEDDGEEDEEDDDDVEAAGAGRGTTAPRAAAVPEETSNDLHVYVTSTGVLRYPVMGGFLKLCKRVVSPAKRWAILQVIRETPRARRLRYYRHIVVDGLLVGTGGRGRGVLCCAGTTQRGNVCAGCTGWPMAPAAPVCSTRCRCP